MECFEIRVSSIDASVLSMCFVTVGAQKIQWVWSGRPAFNASGRVPETEGQAESTAILLQRQSIEGALPPPRFDR
jgi:hypothetical protein